MNVYHRRRGLAKSVADALSGFVVVANPDHPLLMRSADVLIGGSSLMTAAFLPTSEERSDPKKLSARLILNRLALPNHTRCVLVIEEADRSLANRFGNDFAAIVPWTRRGDVAKVAKDSVSPAVHRDVPFESVAEAQRDFSNGMRIMRVVARVARRPFTSAYGEPSASFGPTRSERVSAKSGGRPTDPPSKSQFRSGDAVIPVTDFSGQVPDSLAVAKLISDQVSVRYGLDTGIPIRRDGLTGLAIVEDWPTRNHEREKLIHAAAFAGWAFVLDSQRQQLPKLARRVTERASYE